jgi:hypothetical protein
MDRSTESVPNTDELGDDELDGSALCVMPGVELSVGIREARAERDDDIVDSKVREASPGEVVAFDEELTVGSSVRLCDGDALEEDVATRVALPASLRECDGDVIADLDMDESAESLALGVCFDVDDIVCAADAEAVPAFNVFVLGALCDSRDDSDPNFVRVPSPDALSDFPVDCEGDAMVDGESEVRSDNVAERDFRGDGVSAELSDLVPTALCELDTDTVCEAPAEVDKCSLIDAPAEEDVERLIDPVGDVDADLLLAPEVLVDGVREGIEVVDAEERGVSDA